MKALEKVRVKGAGAQDAQATAVAPHGKTRRTVGHGRRVFECGSIIRL
ncbi:hypothetical protein HH212_08100 [Massilia forsythiae]|uniref:Uncharacterized protein n=1 Tax=Massilia forsythiae TaxID=2728020 RepID=A0A7Z2VW19_9BURK|nr:hypothetical protein [Massilia forsythiae]QJD99989.1 hypothetical protein HH212_08100 [Massilia forsythiae]